MEMLFPDMMPIGTKFELGPRSVGREEIVEFAREYDPAPFHLDEVAAKDTPLGGLCASGFHTCALLMRMMYDSYLDRSTSQGAPGVEKCDWHLPVFVDDTLSGESIVLDVRQSKSRPENFLIRCQHNLRNQHGKSVLTLVNTGIFRSREAFEAG